MRKREISNQSKENRSQSTSRRSFFTSSTRTSSSSSAHSFYERTEHSNLFDDATRRPSAPVYSTDAVPYQMPGYQSPFQRRLGPFASLREGSGARAIYPSTTQSQPRRPSNPSAYQNSSRPAASDPALNSPVPSYPRLQKPKAKVLIINIKKSIDDTEERRGSDNDLKELKKLFKVFKYDVVTYIDLKASEINKKIDEFSRSLAKCDISVVILMSHGNNIVGEKEMPGGFTQIFGADGNPIVTDDILKKFTGSTCPGMLGKPKIFIFQCCRGNRRESLTTDSPKSAANEHADMLIAHSTLPGFFAVRDVEKGSWYIQTICNVFKNFSSEYDVESMLKIVHEQLNTKHPEYKQTSTYENRGFKTCYLQSQR